MTSRELVIKTLNQQPVPRIPRDIWIPWGDDALRSDEVAEMRVRYPGDIVAPESAHSRRASAKAGKSSEHTDAWGCVWADQDGAPAELKHSPLAEGAKIASYQPPAELLDQARFAKANKVCPTTNRFVLAWSEVRPFDRLRFLRGKDAALSDLARGTKDVRALLAVLHDFACRELQSWAASEVDGVVIRDDWGTAEELLLPADLWRDLFRPLYREYCRILHAKDKFVFFRSEGNILDIVGDLVKTGIDAIHCQMHLMGVERLAKRYRGRVTFWGGIDRQQLCHPGSPEQFRDTVLAVRRALDFGCGGVIAQCQWDPGVRLQTVATFFEQWLVPLPMHV
jgi:uroporphyrinogen decarboxylase